MTAEQCLNLIAGEIYFAKGNFGLKMAARNYYDKHPDEFTLEQLSELIAISRNTDFNPQKNPENFQKLTSQIQAKILAFEAKERIDPKK